MSSASPNFVLVADDDEDIRELISAHLRDGGLQVLEAVDGADAIRIAHSAPINLALLDVEMPGLGGYEVLRAFKTDPELKNIPVVLVTARAAAADVAEGLDLGADDYLAKPFQGPVLLARCRSALRAKANRDKIIDRAEFFEREASIDGLTGLANRRHLDEQLAKVASFSQRKRMPLAVLAIDIDHFKNVNDRYGHGAGDEVLKNVAATLRDVVRASDVVGRSGGEEFLIVLPDTDITCAGLLAERLRSAVGRITTLSPGGESITVTVSVGCASAIGSDPKELVRVADAALYVAKKSGRNRVEVSSTTHPGTSFAPGDARSRRRWRAEDRSG
jgi:diguanylate cyclase (GGDEF)-like protein